jgi:cyclophilin family peptidyl-prolyl cis-trans isomerase
MKVQSNLSISSPPPKMKKDTSLRHSNSCVSSGVKSQQQQQQHQQQRLYIAPQSSIRAADADTTVALLQIDTNARRRRQHGNHNSIDLGTLMTFNGTTGSPQSSPSEKSSARYGSTSKNKKSRSTSRRSSHYHNSDDSSSGDDSILDNIEAPCLWMDGVEGNIIPAQFSNGGKNKPLDFTQSWSAGGRNQLTTSANGGESRQRKLKVSTKSLRQKLSSSGSVKSESKHNHYNSYADDGSVHTLPTIHSFKHDVQSKLTIDIGTPDRDGSSRFITRRGDRKSALQQRYRVISNGLGTGNSHTGDKNKCTNYLLMLVQGMVVLLFIYILYDSRRRNLQHQHQLAMLDEERAHILEQMTWIDSAAKKVHKKYASGYDANAILHSATSNKGPTTNNGKEMQHYKDENKILKATVDMLQLRVQQNARTRTSIQFGDDPVQVSLPISEGDVQNEHFVIALSDDAPHAVNTFLQQVSIGLWNEIDFQQIQNGRVVQASTRHSDMKPILEFVEKSRGCHKAGSVALHQLESDDFHVIVLKIHMDASATVDEDDVCIGNVVTGFELLEQIQAQIPTIKTRKIEMHEKE